MANRQKMVYDTDAIAHLWAHQTQSSARNARNNFYFRDDTIYSYGVHFPIARHIVHHGKRAILFTSSTYSVTTAGHISHTRRAIPHEFPCFYVANPLASPSEAFAEFRVNVLSARESLDASKTKAQRVKAWRKLQSATTDANEFAQFFGIRSRFKLPTNSAELDKLATDYETELDARRAKSEATRDARYKARRAAFERMAALTIAERTPLWRAGAIGNSAFPHNAPTLLRLVGKNVETSRGASFPIAHAQRAVRLLGGLLTSGGEYTRNGHTVSLGAYVIDSIDSAGTLRAGCHTIERGELVRFIAELAALPIQV